MTIYEKILISLAIASLAVFGLARTIGARISTSDGIFSRIARPAVAFWGEEIDVELNLDANQLPASATIADIEPVHAILVIDRSGSMMGQPMVEAQNAASDFVDLMNLDPDVESGSDALGVVAFDDSAVLLTAFSTDRNQIIRAIQSMLANGGTAIDTGLNLAHQQFILNPPPDDAQPLIILLSDGQSDPNSAIAAADQAKAQGIRIVTIALGDADPLVLRQIASNEDDFYEASDPTTLIEIYSDIAAGIVGSAATDVSITEYYNDGRFDLASNLYRAQSSNNQITWSLPFIGQRGRSVGYVLAPQRMGLHQVSPTEGQLSLTDSLGQSLNQVTPAGPRVLVLFPVWLLFIAPALAGLWLLYRLIDHLRQPKVFVAQGPKRRDGIVEDPKKREPKKEEGGASVTHGRPPSRPNKR